MQSEGKDGGADKHTMDGFTEQARQILGAAESAAARGEVCSETTILIGQEGGIRILTESDWPLDSLVLHHGARTAYRVTERDGSVRVEGRQGPRSCVLESVSPARTARRLLGSR